MKNTSLKILCCFMAMVLLCFCLFSCDEASNNGNDVSNTNTETEQSNNIGDVTDDNNGTPNGNESQGNEGNQGGNELNENSVAIHNTIAKTVYSVALNGFPIALNYNVDGKFLSCEAICTPEQPIANQTFGFEVFRRFSVYFIYDALGKPESFYAFDYFGELTVSEDGLSAEGKFYSQFLMYIDTIKIEFDTNKKISKLSMGKENDNYYCYLFLMEFDANGNIVGGEICDEFEDCYDNPQHHIDNLGKFIYEFNDSIINVTVKTSSKEILIGSMTLNSIGKPIDFEYFYDDYGLQKAIWQYDDNGKCISVSLPNVSINLTYSYNSEGRLSAIKIDNQEFYNVIYEDDTVKVIPTIVDERAFSFIFTYSSNGMLKKVIRTREEPLIDREEYVIISEGYDYVARTRIREDLNILSNYKVTATSTVSLYTGNTLKSTITYIDNNGNLLSEEELIYSEVNWKLSNKASINGLYYYLDPDATITDIPIYAGYLTQKITGEALIDDNGSILVVSYIVETFDAKGNVIKTEEMTEICKNSITNNF